MHSLQSINFPCTSCGECCRHISHIPDLKSFDNGEGVCIHLLADNRCSVYSQRPDICNINKMYLIDYAKKIDQDEFLRLNAIACNEMQSLANIPISYRVKIHSKKCKT